MAQPKDTKPCSTPGCTGTMVYTEELQAAPTRTLMSGDQDQRYVGAVPGIDAGWRCEENPAHIEVEHRL